MDMRAKEFLKLAFTQGYAEYSKTAETRARKKIPREQVEEMLDLYEQGAAKMSEIAKLYGISQTLLGYYRKKYRPHLIEPKEPAVKAQDSDTPPVAERRKRLPTNQEAIDNIKKALELYHEDASLSLVDAARSAGVTVDEMRKHLHESGTVPALPLEDTPTARERALQVPKKNITKQIRLLYFFHGLPKNEISKKLGIPMSSVESALFT